jgi:hypothetical protein
MKIFVSDTQPAAHAPAAVLSTPGGEGTQKIRKSIPFGPSGTIRFFTCPSEVRRFERPLSFGPVAASLSGLMAIPATGKVRQRGRCGPFG